MPDEIGLILNDRESGSIALLNRLISALEKELLAAELKADTFSNMVITIGEKLHHFAAIENFLESLIKHSVKTDAFPGEALRFIADYKLQWKNSDEKIVENFLQHCRPEGLCILTHSHSQTIISLLTQVHQRKIPFRIMQTLSFPGEEGRISHERMSKPGLQAELIDDADIKEALTHSDLILMGCDAILPGEFLNKTGTLAILEMAGQFNIASFLVAESRKAITRSDWKSGLKDHPLFEWVPLNLIDRIVTERGN